MFALGITLFTHIYCGNYAAADAETDELLALTDEVSGPPTAYNRRAVAP